MHDYGLIVAVGDSVDRSPMYDFVRFKLSTHVHPHPVTRHRGGTKSTKKMRERGN